MSNTATGLDAASAAIKKTPSSAARKLLQKLVTLHPNASVELQKTISNWMVFNRKKCSGMGEGLVLAVESASVIEEINEASARLLLLLRITHQVLLSNCPREAGVDDDDRPCAARGDAEEPTATRGEGEEDKWIKLSQLRSRLGEMAVGPLLQALATSLNKFNRETKGQYIREVKEMMEKWEMHNVFGGPTFIEEYKKEWNRALNDPINESSGKDDVELASVNLSENPTIKEGDQNNKTSTLDDKQGDGVVEAIPTPSVVQASRKSKAAQAPKRDSLTCFDVEVDFEVRQEFIYDWLICNGIHLVLHD